MPTSLFKTLSLGTAIALVAGCATITPDYLDHSLSKPSTGTHPVTVAISNVMLPDHDRPRIFVDGKAAATLGGGQAITMYLPAGQHRIGIGPHAGGSDNASSDASIDIAVSKLSPHIVRAQFMENGHNGWTLSTTRDTAVMPGHDVHMNDATNPDMTKGG